MWISLIFLLNPCQNFSAHFHDFLIIPIFKDRVIIPLFQINIFLPSPTMTPSVCSGDLLHLHSLDLVPLIISSLILLSSNSSSLYSFPVTLCQDFQSWSVVKYIQIPLILPPDQALTPQVCLQNYFHIFISYLQFR